MMHQRLAARNRQRQELLRRCTETAAGDLERQGQLLEELAGVQTAFQVQTAVFVLAVNCSMMTPEQMGAYYVARCGTATRTHTCCTMHACI
jgi:hypothetical protein